MKPRTSLSGLALTATCPGSASLPRVRSIGPEAAFGNAVHEMIAGRIAGAWERWVPGIDDADVARLAHAHGLTDAHARALAFLARTLRLPVPPGALSEVPLGYFADGSVRRVMGAKGEYEDAPGLLLAGTVDAMWAEPEPFAFDVHGSSFPPDEPLLQGDSVLWICDWKSGDHEHVEPIARNWQLRAGALLASKWTGATRVIPAICYVTVEGARRALAEKRAYAGDWEVGAPLGEAELQGIERGVRALLAAAGIGGEDGSQRKGRAADLGVASLGDDLGAPADSRDERVRSRGGGVDGRDHGRGVDRDGSEVRGGPRSHAFVTGPHCDRCPSAGACSAWGGLVRGALHVHAGAGPGLPEARTDVHRLLLTPAERPHVHAAMLAARRFADAAETMLRAGGPVALPGGREYGPALEEVRSVDAAAAYAVLAEHVGEERAWEAMRVSFAAVKEAAGGRSKDVFRELDAMGAIEVSHREVWRVRQRVEVSDVGGELHSDGDRDRRGRRGEGRPEAPDGGLVRDEGMRARGVRDAVLSGPGREDDHGARGRSEGCGAERGEHGSERRPDLLTEARHVDQERAEAGDPGSEHGERGEAPEVPAGDGGDRGGHLLPDGGGRPAREEAAAGEDARGASVGGQRTGPGGAGHQEEDARTAAPPSADAVVARHTRGTCAHCGAPVPLNRDGRPRKHSDPREPDALKRRWGCLGMQQRALPLPVQATLPGA